MPADSIDAMLNSTATEQVNLDTHHIDRVTTTEMLSLINHEDAKIVPAITLEIPAIAAAVDQIAQRMQNGGRLVYCGAGTSGRLGVLDASECPPTYGVSPDSVVGVIAGGRQALVAAIEGAEDNRELGLQDMKDLKLCENDALVGIAASGRTPYVLAAMEYARSLGCLVIGLSCSSGSLVAQAADIAITPIVGPEVITGSTRMKAGTATKLVLNMLSTGTMIRLGKVYGNLMIDLRATNEKLRARARRIVSQAAEVSSEEAEQMLDLTNYDTRLAVFSLLSNLDPEIAKMKLAQAGNRIHLALADENSANLPEDR